MKTVKKLMIILILFFCLFIMTGCISSPKREDRISLEIFRQQDSIHRLSKWPVAFNEILIPTRFGTTYAIESGKVEKPIIILLHAMGFNSLTWSGNVLALSENYRVIALDTIGDQGKSPVRRDYPKDGKEYAEWLNDIIDEIGMGEKVVLIGCSMGGWIALTTAVEYPDKISALVLNSPAAGIPVKTTWMKYLSDIIFNSSEEKYRRAARYLLGGGKAGTDWEDYMVHVVSDIGGAKLGTPKDLSQEELKKLNCPLLLLVGEEEVIYEDKNSLFSIANSIWPNRVTTDFIPLAGHMGHYDNPEYFDKAVLDFLEYNNVK